MQADNTNELIEMIFNLSRLIKDEMGYTNDLIHLSILQIQTLVFLKGNSKKSVSMSDIAEFLHIELPSSTSLVNILCDQKLVRRSTDTKDRRLVIIVLTAEGKTLLERAMVQRRKKLEKMLSYLSDKEKGELSKIVKSLSIKLK